MNVVCKNHSLEFINISYKYPSHKHFHSVWNIQIFKSCVHYLGLFAFIKTQIMYKNFDYLDFLDTVRLHNHSCSILPVGEEKIFSFFTFLKYISATCGFLLEKKTESTFTSPDRFDLSQNSFVQLKIFRSTVIEDTMISH